MLIVCDLPGELVEPGVEVASLYVDQFPDDDLARDVSHRFQVPRYDSIGKALCRGGNRCLFKALSHAIQHLFRTGDPPYPIERTLLLLSGFLEAAVRSHHAGGPPVDTPHLAV